MNYENDKNHEYIRTVYDRIIEDRKTRRRKKMQEVEAELAALEQEDLKELAAALHEAYNSGSTKQVLKHATRQYGNPKFNELWGAVPYTEGNRGVAAKGSIVRTEDTVTFTREGWAWEEVGDEHLTLTYEVQNSSDGRNVLLSSTKDHMVFLRNNLTEIDKVMNNG